MMNIAKSFIHEKHEKHENTPRETKLLLVTNRVRGFVMQQNKFSHVGRNKPVRAVARTGVSGKHRANSPEKLPLLLTPLTYIHVGNATPRATRSSTSLRRALGGLIPAYASSEILGTNLCLATLLIFFVLFVPFVDKHPFLK